MYKTSNYILGTALLLAMTITPSLANSSFTYSINQTTATKTIAEAPAVKTDEAIIEVHGIVCSYCSKGVQNKLSKLGFIDNNRFLDGTLVDIEKQMVTIALKRGSTFNAITVFEAIRDGGYDPVIAYVRHGDAEIITYHPKGDK